MVILNKCLISILFDSQILYINTRSNLFIVLLFEVFIDLEVPKLRIMFNVWRYQRPQCVQVDGCMFAYTVQSRPTIKFSISS